ncbi:MAG: hypothetical protein N3A66_03995 [Planctomycetota bacterium]|nr:hypothetical protein [Planctomycetota bacterium]
MAGVAAAAVHQHMALAWAEEPALEIAAAAWVEGTQQRRGWLVEVARAEAKALEVGGEQIALAVEAAAVVLVAAAVAVAQS